MQQVSLEQKQWRNTRTEKASYVSREMWVFVLVSQILIWQRKQIAKLNLTHGYAANSFQVLLYRHPIRAPSSSQELPCCFWQQVGHHIWGDDHQQERYASSSNQFALSRGNFSRNDVRRPVARRHSSQCLPLAQRWAEPKDPAHLSQSTSHQIVTLFPGKP